MEPSLRSSTPRGVECKLRRTDPALHETMKRFVESICQDVRISQYSDLNYAAKRMETDIWYWLSPLSGGRVGYLIFLPDQPVIWIDDQFKQSFKIQMRVTSDIYKKHTVLIASLNKTDCMLRLEDAWIFAGKSLLDDPFTKRWDTLLEFYSDDFKEDLKLQQGLRIETASFTPLISAKEWLNDEKHRPSLMFAQGNKAPRRLRVQIQEREKAENDKLIVPPFFYADQDEKRTKNLQKDKRQRSDQRSDQRSKAPMFIEEDQEMNVGSDSIAKAIAHEEHPDTYNIWIKGVKKGYAAVQDLELSRILRESTKDKKEVMVRVEWNEEFNMYQIVSQA